MGWIDVNDSLHPVPPMVEVLVKVDGHRGPLWRNTHLLVAYQDRLGNWWEERHPSREPLFGVLAWMPLPKY